MAITIHGLVKNIEQPNRLKQFMQIATEEDRLVNMYVRSSALNLEAKSCIRKTKFCVRSLR
jgi:hypothetical protein